jgi:hypothetical protein
MNIDALVKSHKGHFPVIPAEAGIQSFVIFLDSRLRGSDKTGDTEHWALTISKEMIWARKKTC